MLPRIGSYDVSHASVAAGRGVFKVRSSCAAAPGNGGE